VAPDFYRYRTDYYYEDKGDKETSAPSSRWKDVISQGIGGIRSVLSKMRLKPAAEGKGAKIVILTVLMGLTLIAGLLLYNFPGLSSPTHNKSHSEKVKIVVPPSPRKASIQLPKKSIKAAKKVTKPAEVRRPKIEPAQKKLASKIEKQVEKTEPVTLQSSVPKKPSQVKEAVSFQGSETQTWESLPHTAEIRLGPNSHSPVIQLIRSGTPLQVVGKYGDWLRLQLSNGNTGWLYHSFAQPQREPAEKPLTAAKESNSTSEPLATQSNMMKKARSTRKVLSSKQSQAESYTSLPKVARIRSEPSIHSSVLQLIRRGTRLHVVGKNGAWFKLRLKNESTGWIYHSLAKPEREPVKKPLPVLKGSNGTPEPYSVQPEMTKKAPSAEEVLPLMENGSEVALFYPE
jgi:SH3-like domain-containing protein